MLQHIPCSQTIVHYKPHTALIPPRIFNFNPVMWWLIGCLTSAQSLGFSAARDLPGIIDSQAWIVGWGLGGNEWLVILQTESVLVHNLCKLELSNICWVLRWSHHLLVVLVTFVCKILLHTITYQTQLTSHLHPHCQDTWCNHSIYLSYILFTL